MENIQIAQLIFGSMSVSKFHLAQTRVIAIIKFVVNLWHNI